MADFIRHEPCPGCESSDGLARYDDGSAWCFACEDYHEKGNGTVSNKQSDESPFSNADAPEWYEGEATPLGKRQINAETCAKFGYLVGKNRKGKTVQIAEYRKDGMLVAQKIRTADKKFTVEGTLKGHRMPLFGQHLWRDGGKRLIITEGEIDALTISQLQGNKWPVVSVPNGAPAAKKSIKHHIEWIERFDTVVLAFDMDDPGQKAARECAELLSPGKAKIAHLPEKDPNACHTNGKSKQLIDALWDAKDIRPEGVVALEEVIEEACQPPKVGLPWPWPTLTRVTYGRRRGELYGFGGGTGTGKSTIFKQVGAHIMETEGTPVGFLMLEEAVPHTALTLAGMATEQRLHVPGEAPDPSKVREALDKLRGKAYFFDTRRDHYDYETIEAKIRYLALAVGCKDIFLDHLTAIAATIEDDERKAIDGIMQKLAELTVQLDITLYYVSHLTTPEGKPHEEGGRVMERHFRGSRSIAFWSHFLFGIERNKQDQDGVTTFRVLKDRFTGDSNGVTFGLAYDRSAGLLRECELPSEKDESPFTDVSGDY